MGQVSRPGVTACGCRSGPENSRQGYGGFYGDDLGVHGNPTAAALVVREQTQGIVLTCASLGGELGDVVVKDTTMTFADLVELIHQRFPLPLHTRWKIVLPSGECPEDDQHGLTVGSLL